MLSNILLITCFCSLIQSFGRRNDVVQCLILPSGFNGNFVSLNCGPPWVLPVLSSSLSVCIVLCPWIKSLFFQFSSCLKELLVIKIGEGFPLFFCCIFSLWRFKDEVVPCANHLIGTMGEVVGCVIPIATWCSCSKETDLKPYLGLLLIVNIPRLACERTHDFGCPLFLIFEDKTECEVVFCQPFVIE